MTVRRSPRLALTTLLTLTVAFAAAGCAPTPSGTPADPGAQPSAPAGPTEPGSTPTPTVTVPAVDPADVTCENLIGADLVEELTDQGWTPREDPFIIGDLELADGTSCTWGDFEQATGDDLLLFGWSPITADEASSVQAALESEGWLREEGTEGVYLTEDPSQAIAVDEDGYGMTYLFGDGWVTVSDTKQGLILIERPGA
ncbi:hypothetical protein LJR045_001657 [Microbacterium sp. LjRoot45]|uniref:hypothetical protein n=1 Tax=Microbacterium sp. LjRoot45 TaxID=3342329 RepID=UPI003ECD72A6